LNFAGMFVRMVQVRLHTLLVRVTVLGAILGLALAASVSTASAATLNCGDTVTQNTVLDTDVVCSDPAAVGVVIGADNITLSLNRHTIQGAGATAQGSIGITDDGVEHTGVTISGWGRVDGFDTAVYVGTANSTVKAVRATNSPGGIFVTGNDNFIYKNKVEFAAGAADPGLPALEVDGDNSYLWGNLVTQAPGDAVLVVGENPLIVLNSVDTCQFNGISVGGYTAGKIARNSVKTCDTGIAIAGNGAKLQTNDLADNCDGLFVVDPAAKVRWNNANANTCNGITVGMAGSTVHDNTTNDNGLYGIDAVDGTIDGGGNKATGNNIGNPPGECLGVVCTP
jgi:hypothetical protein